MTQARKTLTVKRKIDRDRVKVAWADVHPGLPQHDRIDMCLKLLVDALCDEIESK